MRELNPDFFNALREVRSAKKLVVEAPTTRKGQDWERSNEKVAKSYPKPPPPKLDCPALRTDAEVRWGEKLQELGVTPTMMRDKMSEKENRKMMSDIEKLPKRVVIALRNSPFKDVLPQSMLQFTMKPGTYSGATQRMGMFLHSKKDPLLKILLEEDLMSLREVPEVSTHQARTFYFQK